MKARDFPKGCVLAVLAGCLNHSNVGAFEDSCPAVDDTENVKPCLAELVRELTGTWLGTGKNAQFEVEITFQFASDGTYQIIDRSDNDLLFGLVFLGTDGVRTGRYEITDYLNGAYFGHTDHGLPSDLEHIVLEGDRLDFFMRTSARDEAVVSRVMLARQP